MVGYIAQVQQILRQHNRIFAAQSSTVRAEGVVTSRQTSVHCGQAVQRIRAGAALAGEMGAEAGVTSYSEVPAGQRVSTWAQGETWLLTNPKPCPWIAWC